MNTSLARMASRALVLVSLGSVVCVAVAGSEPDLDAVVTHESTSVSRNGVTRTERFEERVIRRQGHVWTERVGAAAAPANPDHDAKNYGAEHRHFDFESAARHVMREADGKTHLEYVDREKKWTVFVPAAEYGPVGFLGNWDAEFYLTPPALVAAIPVLASQKSGTPNGAIWHEERRGGWTHRVLWSHTYRYPLAIEAIRDDGGLTRRTSVKIVAPTPADRLPWRGLSAYRSRSYDDFMD